MAPTPAAPANPGLGPRAEDNDRPKVDSGKVVKYVGTADERVIDAKAWKSIDVEDQGKVVWNRKNKFTVPVTELTDNAVQYLEEDSGFVLVDADTK